MKSCRAFAIVVAVLFALALCHAQRPSPKKKPPPTPQSTNPVSKEKSSRERIVTHLSGFELDERPAESKRMAVAATRDLPRPVALAPRLGKAYAQRLVFEWRFDGTARDFILTLRDDAKNEVLRTEVAGTRYAYPPDAPALEPGKTYYWTVQAIAALSPSSSPAGIVLTSGKERAKIESALGEALAASAEPCVQGLARARLFTDFRLWYDAIAAYTELIAQYPDRAELYEERGTIHAQLEITWPLAERDFARSQELAQEANRSR